MRNKQDWMPIGIVDQIEKYEFAIKQAQNFMNLMNQELREWQNKLIDQALIRIGREAKDVWFDLEHGWKCSESPLGTCIYEVNGGYDDVCIICEEPDERK